MMIYMETTATTIPSPSQMIGLQVEGTYMGEPFVGTVFAARYHTMNHRVGVYHVTTEDFTYDGIARDGVCIEVNHQTGRHEPTYGSDYGCSIRPVV
jgi:hypothetical protein